MVKPSVIERTLPVKSYDITINSSDGQEIWKKANQVPQGGRGPQIIMLDNYDIGNISIGITNIAPEPTFVDILNQNTNNTNEFAALNQTKSNLPTDSKISNSNLGYVNSGITVSIVVTSTNKGSD